MSKKNSKESKALRREERTSHKNRTVKEEKSSRPNNLLLGILIFGAIIAMFVVGWSLKYFQKDATIAKYLKNNDTYSNMQMDEETTVDITAKRNKMDIKMNVTTENEDTINQIKEYYEGEDGTKNLKYFGAYYLSSIKPETRAIFADANISLILNGKELASTYITCFDADRLMNGTYYPDDKEDAEEAEDAEDGEAEEADGNEAIELDGDETSKTIEVDEDGNMKVVEDGEQ